MLLSEDVEGADVSKYEQEVEIIYPVEGELLKTVCLRAARMYASFDWLLKRDDDSVQVFEKGRGDQFVAAVTKDTHELVGLLGFFDGYKDPFIVYISDFQRVYGYWRGIGKYLSYKSFTFIVFCSYGKYYYCHNWVHSEFRKAKVVNSMGLYSGIWHSMAVKADEETCSKPLLTDVRRSKPKVMRLLQFHGFVPLKWSFMGAVLGLIGYTRLVSYKKRKHKSGSHSNKTS